MSRSYQPDRRHLILAGAVGAAGLGWPNLAAGQELAPTLKTGVKMLSESIRADLREGDVGSELGEIAKANPDVTIGSYPFFDDKLGPNTNIVVRGSDQGKLSAAKKSVEEMLARVRATMREQA